MKRLSICAYRVFLTLLGVLLIVLSFPHGSPAFMTNLVRESHDGALFFAVQLPFAPSRFFLSTAELALVATALLGLIIGAIPRPTLMSVWQSFRSQAKAFTGGIIATVALMASLVPPDTYLLTQGSGVVLYLLTASSGIALFVAGTFPILCSISESTFASRMYGFVRGVILNPTSLRFVATLAILELLFATIVSLIIFDGIPHVQDSIAQYFHAKIVAAGSMTAPSPSLPEFFDYLTVINDGQWYSQYPPGHTLLLALGVLWGTPWIINPLLGSLTIMAIFFLGKELYGENVGRLSALLAFLSPFILFMSSEFMNHSSSLLFAILFVLFSVRSLRSGTFVHGLMAGACLGFMVCIRPYTAVAIAVPMIFYGLLQVPHRFHDLRRSGLGFLLSCIALVGLLLAFNEGTTGDPFLFGYEKLWGSQVGVGLGKGLWDAPHSFTKGVQQVLMNLNGINKYLFEWPIPALSFAALLFFTGKSNHWDRLLAFVFFSLSFFYIFYWFSDWCFGPRYLYEASFCLIILTARGIEQIPIIWSEVLGFGTFRKTIRVVTFLSLLLMFSLGLSTNLPPLLKQYGAKYWDVDGQLLQAVEERGIRRAIVFVKGTYGSGFVGNDPFLRNTVIYVRDLGERNREIMELYPDYDYYIAETGRLLPQTGSVY